MLLALPNNSTVAILNENKISIYNVETQPRFIANIERPAYIQEGVIPTATFFSLNNDCVYLIIFWGKFIFLVKKQTEQI